jgi:DNA-binding transcriptional regulator YiaG
MPPPEDRYPLSKDKLNKLFRECTRNAGSKRPEDVWLPLLGYLTGARLGELVGLRTQDIELTDGVWTAELSSRIDGEASIAPSYTRKKGSRKKGRKNREIKNPDSLRRFALHHKLTDLGFIDWVGRQRDEGHIYLFPDLHNIKSKRPSDAAPKRPSGVASKRMQRLFETLKMGSKYVFHSLRHSFKDWAREGEIAERTIALQAGHSLEGVALNYGSKVLTDKQLQQIASLPIADGVELDVFKGVFVKTSRNLYRRKALVESLQRGASEGEEGPVENAGGVVKVRSRPVARDADEAAISVRNLRAELEMSQKEFANAYGFSCGAVRDWEQGRTKPGYSARTRLYEIARDPERMITSRSDWPNS